MILSISRNAYFVIAMGLMFGAVAATNQARAGVGIPDVTVSDGNASITFGDDSDLKTFSVGGVDHLSENEWHLCFGAPGSFASPCVNNGETDGPDFDFDIADALGDAAVVGDDDANTIVATWTSAGIIIEETFTLDGSGPGAFLDDTTVITNTADTPLEITLFKTFGWELSDFEDSDSAFYDGDGTFVQFDGLTTATVSAITPFGFFGFCDEDIDDGECELEDDATFGVAFDNHLFFSADEGFAGIFGPGDIAYSI